MSIFKIWILKDWLQSTYVALVVFRGVIKITEVEGRVKNQKNGKSAAKVEFTREIIKDVGDMVVDRIW